MKNKQTTKYRLILSLTDQDIAFERLFSELMAIEREFSDAKSINHAKRKHFLKILLAYCNQRLRDDTVSTALQPFETVAANVTTAEPIRRPSPSPPPRPPPFMQETIQEMAIPPSGLPNAGGIINFGKFNLEIK